MEDAKPIIAIIDNSISFTGAFKAALTEAELLKQYYRFLFIVPKGSEVIKVLKEKDLEFYTLSFAELSRSPKQLLRYFPVLIGNAVKLRALLRREQVHVLQINDFYNLLGVAVKVLGFKGKLITYVRFLPLVMPAPLRMLWIKLAQKYSHSVIAVSDAVLNQLPRHRNTVRIYDAITFPERLKTEMLARADCRANFLYLANYIKGKGQDHMLRAWREVIKSNKNVFLKFVGGDMGLTKNKSYKKALEQYVESSGLSDFVSIGSFEHDIEAAIKSADVVLNFSEAESFSMTCAEASFYGVPVIASRCGGPEEIVQHQKTGLLVENRNIEQMRDAVLLLVESPVLRAQYGAAARAFVLTVFNPEQYVKNFTALLNA